LDVIELSNQAIHHAKRAIFALHRDDKKEAGEKLNQSEILLKNLVSKYKKEPDVLEEGAYRAGLEEYTEAKLFYGFLTTGKIGKITDINVPDEVYIGGLCDVPGELYRYAIKSATARDIEMTKKCAQIAQEIIGELIEFNLTSYLRTKFDQAKQAVQKLEQVVYEVSLRE
jgi:predicted translin family RNA/ssDNA-binding protein